MPTAGMDGKAPRNGSLLAGVTSFAPFNVLFALIPRLYGEGASIVGAIIQWCLILVLGLPAIVVPVEVMADDAPCWQAVFVVAIAGR